MIAEKLLTYQNISSLPEEGRLMESSPSGGWYVRRISLVYLNSPAEVYAGVFINPGEVLEGL